MKEFFSGIPKAVGTILLTVLIASATTILANYTNSVLNQQIDEQQTQLLETLSNRVMYIEQNRYTEGDANRDTRSLQISIQALQREIDLMRDDLKEIKRRMD